MRPRRESTRAQNSPSSNARTHARAPRARAGRPKSAYLGGSGLGERRSVAEFFSIDISPGNIQIEDSTESWVSRSQTLLSARVSFCAAGLSSYGLLKPYRLQEARQFRSRPILRNWVQLLERTGERVGQAPHRSRLELLMNRSEIQVVHSPCQMLGESGRQSTTIVVDYLPLWRSSHPATESNLFLVRLTC
jgi:hypothetical protein